MNCPNLFIVGAPKCGTSALYSYLKQHPKIFMSERKEPQFFCTDFWEESDTLYGRKKFFNIRSENEYLRLFKHHNEEKIIGEATSKYLYSKIAAKNIYNFNPDAKIIIMLREPVDFLYSYHSQCLYDAVEDERDFKTALGLEESRKKGKKIPIHTPVPSYAYYSEMAKFSVQISRFKQFFPEENIKIIIFDDFRDDPEDVYYDVLHFLGIGTVFTPDFSVVNSNKKIRLFRLNTILNNYSTLFLKYLPVNLYKKLLRLYYIINIHHTERPPLNDDIRLNLKKNFHSEIKVLSKFLDRNLTDLWDYSKFG
jgi:hypothetical protein